MHFDDFRFENTSSSLLLCELSKAKEDVGSAFATPGGSDLTRKASIESNVVKPIITPCLGLVYYWLYYIKDIVSSLIKDRSAGMPFSLSLLWNRYGQRAPWLIIPMRAKGNIPFANIQISGEQLHFHHWSWDVFAHQVAETSTVQLQRVSFSHDGHSWFFRGSGRECLFMKEFQDRHATLPQDVQVLFKYHLYII